MTHDETLAVVRRYHAGWTNRRFEEAFGCLAPDLTIEVPINAYDSRESFAQAVAAFAGMTRRVTLLAELADGKDAVLVYDMDLEQIGSLRVAEHFTVEAGHITRIRQIHDTWAVRAAGLGKEPA